MDEPRTSTNGTKDGFRLSRRSAVIIAVYGATLLLVRFGPGWALTYHEAFYCEPAREFLLTGDWVAPRIGGVLSWQKPPLALWATAGSMALFGTEAEWAVRLPALLATLANALLVAALAARWHGDRVGRLAGLIQLTTVYGLIQGRLAEPDMFLCATVTAAFAAFAWDVVPRPDGAAPSRRRWLPLAFFGVVGLSLLTKGPIGPVFIAGGAGLDAILTRDRRSWRFLLDPVGWLVMLAVALPWYAAGYLRDPSGFTRFLFVNVVQRFRGGVGGPTDAEASWYYLYTVPVLLLPWTPLALFGWFADRGRGDRPVALRRLLSCWFVVGLGVISAASWKAKHYAIPVLPPLTVFAALGLNRALACAWRPRATRVLAEVVVALSLTSLALAALGRARRAEVLLLAAPLGASAASGVLIFGLLMRRGRRRPATAALFGTILATFVLLQSLVMPALDLYREQAAFTLRTNARAADGQPILGYRIVEPQAYYYLRHPVERHDDRASLVDRLSRAPVGRPLLVVAPAAFRPDLEALGRVELLDQCPDLARLTALRFTPDPPRVVATLQDLSDSVRR